MLNISALCRYKSDIRCVLDSPPANQPLESLEDPNAIGRYHRSPLWRASYAGNHELIRMLLRSGGDPRECDEQGASWVCEVPKKYMVYIWFIYNVVF